MATWLEFDVLQGMGLHRADTIAGSAWKVARFQLMINEGTRRGNGRKQCSYICYKEELCTVSVKIDVVQLRL
jgi:hypothetical protein